MDSLTHLVSGGLMAAAFPGAPRRRAMLLFGMAAASVADIDAFFSGGDPVSMMTLHRGLTHALFMQPLLALGVTLPFFLFLSRHLLLQPAPPPGPRPRAACGMTLPMLLACALLCLGIHLFLDSMTTYGTQVFLPFSDVRVALPAMFIIDPFCTLPALALLGAALRLPPEPALCHWAHNPKKPCGTTLLFSVKAKRLARLGVAWLLLYPLCALAFNMGLTALYASQENLPRDRVTLLTEPFSPLVWKLVIDGGDHFRMRTALARPSPEVTVAKADEALLDTLARQSDLVRHFRQFAPLMGQETAFIPNPWRPGEQLAQHTFFSMRYLVSPRSLMRAFGVTETYFAVQVLADPEGQVWAARFLKKRRADPGEWAEESRVRAW
jgi:Predicted membrane-bound metal-dependent hydrolases